MTTISQLPVQPLGEAASIPLDPKIFNTAKTDYESTSLLMGTPPGLFDSVNKRFPEIWKLYKSMKSLDWDENEFKYDTCNPQFKTCPPAVREMMIRTLAWQWEADSMAARQVAPIMACFNPTSELWAAYSAVGTNEVLHALTYSEIVRLSFDNPDEVLSEILAVQESLQRMEHVGEVMRRGFVTAHKFALGMVENDQDTYNDAYMVVVAMLVLERLQFIGSFAITFAIANTGLFMPIGKAVQKIAQDELEIHVQIGKQVLAHENTTERGKTARRQCADMITKLIGDVLMTEINWAHGLFSEGRELLGMNSDLLIKWDLFNAKDLYEFFGIPLPEEFDFPEHNPLKFMEKWLNIAMTQAAPMEQQNGQYKLNVMRRTDEGKVFDADF